MKPFNLEKAKAGEPVQMGDGRPVTFLRFDVKSGRPIAAIVTENDADYTPGEELMCFDENGDNGAGYGEEFNLFMVSKTMTGWVAIGRVHVDKFDTDPPMAVCGDVYPTKEAAKRNCTFSDADIIEIKWEVDL